MADFLHEYIEKNGEKISNGYWLIDYDLNLLVDKKGYNHKYIPHDDDEIIYNSNWETIKMMEDNE